MHDVCTQSYMLPVKPLIDRGSYRPPNFVTHALRSPSTNNAVIVTEHLTIPRASFDVPANFLEQREEKMRTQLRQC